MTLTKKEMQDVFDLENVRRGDCIRFRKTGDTEARNGFVTEVKLKKLTALYCNVQNNSCSYVEIPVSEVAAGMWEIYWTRDFRAVYHEGAETGNVEEE